MSRTMTPIMRRQKLKRKETNERRGQSAPSLDNKTAIKSLRHTDNSKKSRH